MAYVTINATQLKNCTLLIKDGYNREVAYTWSEDRKTISTEMVEDQAYAFIVTADDGYVFNNPVIYDYGSSGLRFTVHDDKKTATFYGSNAQPYTIRYSKIKIIAVAEESTEPPKVTEHYEHCTSNITGQTLVRNQSYNIVLTAESGYYFNDSPVLNARGNTYNFTISPDAHTAALDYVVTGDFTITATAIDESVIPPKVTEILEHCTSNITGRTLVRGERYDIVLSADSGYYFNNPPTVNEGGYIYEFNLSSDRHSAALNSYVVINDFTITATAVSEGGESDDYTFFRMYSPDDKYLSDFADNIVYQISGEGFNEYDLTPYIYALYVLPFKLSTLVELKNVPGIEFNKYTYKSEVPSILNSDRIFTIDFGELNFEREFNSDFDFDCSIRLDVPFFDSIVLNPYDVIGRSVQVVGYVNLFNRTMNITVTGEDGDIIAEQKRQIGYSIPYLSQSYKTASTYSDEMTNSLTGIQAIETYDFEIKNVSELSGYVKADFVVPEEADFIGEDWDNIRAILESGVIYG